MFNYQGQKCLWSTSSPSFSSRIVEQATYAKARENWRSSRGRRCSHPPPCVTFYAARQCFHDQAAHASARVKVKSTREEGDLVFFPACHRLRRVAIFSRATSSFPEEHERLTIRNPKPLEKALDRGSQAQFPSESQDFFGVSFLI